MTDLSHVTPLRHVEALTETSTQNLDSSATPQNDVENLDSKKALKLQEIERKNSLFYDITYRIDENIKLRFPSFCKDYMLIAVSTWNHIDEMQNGFIPTRNYSRLRFDNKITSISKDVNFLKVTTEFHHDFIIDEASVVYIGNEAGIHEFYHNAHTDFADSKKHSYCDIVGFLLVYIPQNFHIENLDFSTLGDENIEIVHDYSHLIPQIEVYKEVIDEYVAKSSNSLQNQINNLISERNNLILDKERLIAERDRLMSKMWFKNHPIIRV